MLPNQHSQLGNLTKEQMEMAKDKYFRYFMIDFMEYNLRKVVSDNTVYCAQKCKLFDNVEDLSNEKQEFSCFEKCIGKFGDSYEHALDVFGKYLQTMNKQKVFAHSQLDKDSQEKRFLLGEGSLEPVYDKPPVLSRGNRRKLDD